MIIILEGPDGGGKTTLAGKLLHLPSVVPTPMLGGRTQPAVTSRQNTYRVLYEHKGRTMLCERFHPFSDSVYRQLDDRPPIFSKGEIESISRQLVAAGAVIIYCRPPIEVPMRGLVAKGDDDMEWMATLRGNLSKIFREYDLLMLRLTLLGVRVVHYDFTDDWSQEMAEAACAV